jgi:mannose-6-phosphate isomerase-like protein (cupin superfamily)
MQDSPPPYEVVDFNQIDPVACPCGQARRAFAATPDLSFTLHRTEISLDAALHYHDRITETYYFLECGPDARMQLNGDIIPVHPSMAIAIRPGTRHRALGRMTVLIIAWPKFDPRDEHVVEDQR